MCGGNVSISHNNNFMWFVLSDNKVISMLAYPGRNALIGRMLVLVVCIMLACSSALLYFS